MNRDIPQATAGSRRTAIVLMNLGGPDRPEAVRPFLFNLFNDPAILRVPGLVRLVLATLISRTRAKKARANYALMGGGSPLVPNTEAQARALQAALADLGEVKIAIAMRYWHPFSVEAAEAVRRFAPDRVLLLPLYPQWSTTTSASSIKAWDVAARTVGLSVPTQTLCCWPEASGFVAAYADLIATGLRRAAMEMGEARTPIRLLLSAHGLPEKVVAAGDPYADQCEATVRAILAALPQDLPAFEPLLCYQSRVGPLAWIGPDTEASVRVAAGEGRAIVVAPIAFVSDHIETLVELDHEYRALALAGGAPTFVTVPAVGTHPAFIQGLAQLVRQRLAQPAPLCSGQAGGERWCATEQRGCAFSTLPVS